MEGIHAALLGPSTLVFHRVGLPQAVLALEGNTGPAPVKFQNVTGTGNAQGRGEDPHIPGDEQVPAALGKPAVVGVFVKDCSVGGAEIFRPLILNMDECPLAAAELEVLQTGELKEILLGIGHPIRVQVTPLGSWSSATVTV